jgi:hypothetical protein
MRRLYLIVPGQELTERLIRELESEGLATRKMSLYAQRPTRSATLTLPVRPMRASPWRSMWRALFGALTALIVALVLMVFGGLQIVLEGLLVVALLGALVGLSTARWGLVPPEVKQLRKELRPDDLVMLVDVPDDLLGQLEQTINTAHPEIRIKGTDPRGSPPFP